MALVINGPQVLSTVSEKRRLCERYLPHHGLTADECPYEGDDRFAQTVLSGWSGYGVSVLAKETQHVSYWRPGVRVWDVLRLREDYRKIQQKTQDKIDRMNTAKHQAQARVDDFWETEGREMVSWFDRNRNEGRYSVMVPSNWRGNG